MISTNAANGGGSKYIQDHKHKYPRDDGAFAGSVNNDWHGGNTGGILVLANDTQTKTGNVADLRTGNAGNLQPYIVVYKWKLVEYL